MTSDTSDVRIIICGSRTWKDEQAIHQEIERLRSKYGSRLVIVHGAHWEGADSIADRYCRKKGIRREPHPAWWSRHGNAAGPIRNQEMADAGADGCIAFNEGTRGTNDMIDRALAAGIPVLEIIPHGIKRVYTP